MIMKIAATVIGTMNGIIGSIKWNFTKFLISRKGNIIERFSPMTTPASLEEKIKSLL